MSLAIAGIPGAGKTTLALHLMDELGWPILSSGDIARAVDPGGVAAGGLADEASFRSAWFKQLGLLQAGPVIFDGIPRSREQVELLPNGTQIIMLVCPFAVAVSRLTRRGRADDTTDVIVRRLEEQVALLEAAQADGWLYRLIGMQAVFRTDRKTPQELAALVVERLGVWNATSR